MLDQILHLEKTDTNVYVAHHHQENFRKTLFGGQVLAQALMAAGQTTQRPIHSLHAYFLRPGKTTSPVYYRVQVLRDGQSVSTREVTAAQDQETIFSMLCSFHQLETGYEHQLIKAPKVPTPQQLLHRMSQSDREHLHIASETLGIAPIEFLPCKADLFSDSSASDAKVQFWMRGIQLEDNDLRVSSCALAFASDIGLLATTLQPHDTSLFSGKVLPASMDHSIWFHRPSHFNQWHLYSTDSPWAGNARGFCRGAIFNEQGILVASTAQEGLIRPIRS